MHFDTAGFFISSGVKSFRDIGKGITMGDEFCSLHAPRGNKINSDIKICTHATETVAIGTSDIDFGPDNRTQVNLERFEVTCHENNHGMTARYSDGIIEVLRGTHSFDNGVISQAIGEVFNHILHIGRRDINDVIRTEVAREVGLLRIFGGDKRFAHANSFGNRQAKLTNRSPTDHGDPILVRRFCLRKCAMRHSERFYKRTLFKSHIGQFEDTIFVRGCVFRKTTMRFARKPLAIGAVIVATCNTVVTGTAMRKTFGSNEIPYLDICHTLANFGNRTTQLVPRGAFERGFPLAKIIVQIATADTRTPRLQGDIPRCRGCVFNILPFDFADTFVKCCFHFYLL